MGLWRRRAGAGVPKPKAISMAGSQPAFRISSEYALLSFGSGGVFVFMGFTTCMV